MVIVAIGLSVLLAFGAFAVDMSMLYLENTRLQTALDAGVLAGASMLPDRDAAIQEAQAYIQANGYSIDGIAFSFEGDDMIITANSTQTVDAAFSRIMGYETHAVSSAASAEKYTPTIGGPFDYMLFSGDPGHTLTLGGRYNIGGSVHSNGNLYASPSSGTITGAAEACGTVYINPSTATAGAEVPGAEHIDMPNFSGVVADALPAGYDTVLTPAEVQSPWWKQVFNGNTYVSGSCTIGNQCEINGTLYVQGDLTIGGGSPACVLNGTIYATGNITFTNTFQGVGNVFAGGNITFRGGFVQLDATKSISVYSETGNIDIGTAGNLITGIVYAPNGTAKVQGGDTTFYGSIIANRITGIPANLVMRTPEEPFPFITTGEDATRLVR